VLDKPRSAEAWGALGMLLLANGFAEDSLGCFDRAARLDPADARWPYLHGLARQPLDPDGAVEHFREATRRVGDGREGAAGAVRLRYAEALMRTGGRAEAKSLLLDVLAHDPDNPRALLALGILAHDGNEPDAAEGYLLRCVRSPLSRQRATVRLSALYQEKGDAVASERYRRQAAGMPRDPEGPDPIAEESKRLLIGRRASLLRAEFLLRANQTAEAAALLRRLLDQHPDEAEASVKLGLALVELGRSRDAEEVLRNPKLHQGGDRAQVHFFLGMALFQQKKYEEAAKEERLALAVKPDHAGAHLYLGMALLEVGQRKEGVAELEQAVRFSPESVDTHLQLGRALVTTAARRDEGFRHLDRAVELAGEADPRPGEMRQRLRDQYPQSK
jgi:tetratricopeptide (TPR) repeat protein